MSTPRWISTSAPYVRPRREGEQEAWAEEAAQHGHRGTSQLLEVSQIAAPSDIARDLGLETSQLVIVRRRLILLDDRPVELADSYYPALIARGTALEHASKIRGGAVTLLAELGYTADRIEEAVSARPATATERELLQLDPADWILVLRRVSLDSTGRPFEIAVMTMVAEGRELRYEMRGKADHLG